MTKQLIAVDLDDVLAHSTESFRRSVNDIAGIQLTAADYAVPGAYWGYYERVWQSHGIADKVPADILHDQMAIDQSHVPAYKDAHSALLQLSHRFRLVIVTARYDEWQDATRRWVELYYPNVFDEVIFAGNKHAATPETKGEACKRIGASYLIDDNPEHAASAVNEGMTAVLFGEYGWHIDVPMDMVRCKSWQNIQQFFDKIQTDG